MPETQTDRLGPEMHIMYTGLDTWIGPVILTGVPTGCSPHVKLMQSMKSACRVFCESLTKDSLTSRSSLESLIISATHSAFRDDHLVSVTLILIARSVLLNAHLV